MESQNDIDDKIILEEMQKQKRVTDYQNIKCWADAKAASRSRSKDEQSIKYSSEPEKPW